MTLKRFQCITPYLISVINIPSLTCTANKWPCQLCPWLLAIIVAIVCQKESSKWLTSKILPHWPCYTGQNNYWYNETFYMHEKCLVPSSSSIMITLFTSPTKWHDDVPETAASLHLNALVTSSLLTAILHRIYCIINPLRYPYPCFGIRFCYIIIFSFPDYFIFFLYQILALLSIL